MVDTLKSEAETLQALGMQGAAYQRWQIVRREALCDAIQASDTGSFWAAASHGIRFLLQSAILGIGAWLTLKGELTPGAMIAGSILLGRALAPVEAAVGQWPAVQGALEGWQRLAILLSLHPAGEPRTLLPRPRPLLEVQHLSVIPPGAAQPTLRMVSFQLTQGQAIGVIGPSGAGKSSLARALTGVWPVAGGSIRLDGATPDQYGPDTFGSYFGYLPQRVTLFDGTIAENIARLSVNPDTTAIVDAARRAAAHDMILQLPLGYDTPVSALGGRLSGGQVQRIGLARALFGNPVILILDEPNSNLDNDGTTALNHAIRTMKRAGGAVLIMAHRPAAIQECDLLLVLENGARRAFGPRDQILRDRVTNHSDLVRQTGARGVASLWEAP